MRLLHVACAAEAPVVGDVSTSHAGSAKAFWLLATSKMAAAAVDSVARRLTTSVLLVLLASRRCASALTATRAGRWALQPADSTLLRVDRAVAMLNNTNSLDAELAR